MTLEEILANIEAKRQRIAVLANSTKLTWGDEVELEEVRAELKNLYAKRNELMPREGRRSSVARGGKNKKKEQHN